MTGERSSGWLVMVGDERKEAVGGGREERERGKRQIKNKKIPYSNIVSVLCLKICVHLSFL